MRIILCKLVQTFPNKKLKNYNKDFMNTLKQDLERYNMLSEDGVITPKQSKWFIMMRIKY